MTFCLISLRFCVKECFTANLHMSLRITTRNAGFRLNTRANSACNCGFLQQPVTNDNCTYRLYICVCPHQVTWSIRVFDWSLYIPYDAHFHPAFCLLTLIVWCSLQRPISRPLCNASVWRWLNAVVTICLSFHSCSVWTTGAT